MIKQSYQELTEEVKKELPYITGDIQEYFFMDLFIVFLI
jgi:hypothetical protein